MELATKGKAFDAVAPFVVARARYIVLPAPRPTTALVVSTEVPQDARDAIKYLTRVIAQDFVGPALMNSASKDELSEFLGEHWSEYVDTLNALHAVIARASSEEKAFFLTAQSADDDMKKLGVSMSAICGAGAADEIDFVTQTMKRAIHLVPRIASLGDASDRDADCGLASQFRSATALYAFALTALFMVEAGLRVTSNEVLLQLFDYLRGGALNAYASARQAIELRKFEVGDLEPLPFDDEDEALANEGFDEGVAGCGVLGDND